MKKTLIATGILVTVILLLSVGRIVFITLFQYNRFYQDVRNFADCVMDEDRDAIYDSFCDNYRNNDDFRSDLNEFLDLLYSYDLDYSQMKISYEGDMKVYSYQHGNLVDYSTLPTLRYVYDSDENEYEIVFGYTGKSSTDSNSIGITGLQLNRVFRDEAGNPRYEAVLYIGDNRYKVSQHEGEEGFYYVG